MIKSLDYKTLKDFVQQIASSELHVVKVALPYREGVLGQAEVQ